jgi:CspA family cold shock protein
MATGTIKKIVTDRGFGFIKGEDGKDVFFHVSSCKQTPFDALIAGDSVEYDIDTRPNPKGNGPRAATVRKVAGVDPTTVCILCSKSVESMNPTIIHGKKVCVSCVEVICRGGN